MTIYALNSLCAYALRAIERAMTHATVVRRSPSRES